MRKKQLAQDRGERCYMSDYDGFSQLSLTYIKFIHVIALYRGWEKNFLTANCMIFYHNSAMLPNDTYL